MSASKRSKKRKPNSVNPAKQTLHIDEHPLAKRLYRRIEEGTLLVRDLQSHITPMGESTITLEQWRFLRGSVLNDFLLYAQLTGKPSPIDIIVASEQERVLIES